MICPHCEHQNPESNKFCGMCGGRLSPVESQERSDQETTPVDTNGGLRRPFIVSTTAMADVTAQMLNSRVVLPSPTLASTHSGYASPLKPSNERAYRDQVLPPEPAQLPKEEEAAVEEEQQGSVHEFDLDSPEEAEAERWLEQTAAEHESRMPPVSSTPQSGSILGLSAPDAESSYDRADTRESELVRDRNSFLYIEDAHEDRSRDVSGPSFLGLGNDATYEDDQPSGHGRLYLLLATLIIVSVLGVLEWRASLNGDSTNPMDVLHLKLPKKKGQGQAEVVPPSNASNTPAASGPTDNAPAPATTDDGSSKSSSAGKPDMIADQSQPSTPKATADNGSPNAAAPQPQTSSNTQEAAPTATKATSTAPAPAKAAETTSKAPAQSTEIANANPRASASKPVAAEPARTTKPAASKPATVAAEPAAAPDTSLSAGGPELQKGVAAGPTELGRMWLWKATAKGNGEAPVLLADMYAQGKGVPKDCEQAMLLLNAAAKKMNVRARSKLGTMYAAGECVPQDRVKAYKWMSSALEANPGSEWLEKNRESLLRDMTPAERQRASR